MNITICIYILYTVLVFLEHALVLWIYFGWCFFLVPIFWDGHPETWRSFCRIFQVGCSYNILFWGEEWNILPSGYLILFNIIFHIAMENPLYISHLFLWAISPLICGLAGLSAGRCARKLRQCSVGSQTGCKCHDELLDLTHISPKFAANQLHLDSYCLPDATTRPACHQWTNGPKVSTSWTNSIQKSDVNVL